MTMIPAVPGFEVLTAMIGYLDEWLHDNLAAIDPLSRGQRRSRWALNPLREPSGSSTADATRFIDAPKLMEGLGRKHEQS